MKAKNLFIGGMIFSLAASIFWAQEKEKPAETKPPATAAQAPAAPRPPHTFVVTPEDEARKNPLRFSEISVERGKKLYRTQCAMCHGAKGEGKGDLAQEMNLQLPDFTKPSTLKNRTDGALFAIISSGNDVMPAQGKRLLDIHKWEMVNYLRTLGGATPFKSTEEELHRGTIPVPR